VRIILCLIVCICLNTQTVFANSSQNTALNKQAPSFILSDINREKRSIKEWKGNLIILNFWATWCLPCKEEIPLLNEFHKQYKDQDLSIVGIAVDHWAAVKKFNKHIPIDYVNLIGNIDSTLLVKRYGNKTGALPYTVIIEPSGKIVSIASGQLTRQYLKKTIQKHL